MCLKTSQIVIGIIITLCLTSFCCCYIIPQNTGDLSKDLVLLAKGERTVQICGATLTNFLQILCRGNFNRMSAGGISNDEKKLTDYCCRQPCKISVLAQVCEEPPVFLTAPGFVTRSSRQLPNDIQNHPSKLIRASASKKNSKNNLKTTKSEESNSEKGKMTNLERNNTMMPLQVDTIPPNFESLGAMPEVVP